MTPHDHIIRLLAILTRIGGYLTPEDQDAIAEARAEASDVPAVQEWRDRGEWSGATRAGEARGVGAGKSGGE